MKYEQKRKAGIFKKSKIVIGVIIAVALLLVVGFLIIQQNYTITNVSVEGNIHYTKEEIQDMVMEGVFGNNSLLLSLKYKNKEIKNIPFIETMDVKILSPNTIKISVYEKALAGYVEFLEHYMYFDKDGVIVESSDKKTNTIPQVTGLEFGYVVLYEKLPVENNKIFQQILSVTQLLTKYEIIADKIYFDSIYDMTLYFGKARVMVGSLDFLDEKILGLKEILPKLEGKSGTLHMENYSEDSKYVSFELD